MAILGAADHAASFPSPSMVIAAVAFFTVTTGFWANSMPGSMHIPKPSTL